MHSPRPHWHTCPGPMGPTVPEALCFDYCMLPTTRLRVWLQLLLAAAAGYCGRERGGVASLARGDGHVFCTFMSCLFGRTTTTVGAPRTTTVCRTLSQPRRTCCPEAHCQPPHCCLHRSLVKGGKSAYGRAGGGLGGTTNRQSAGNWCGGGGSWCPSQQLQVPAMEDAVDRL